jgi:hypothetical protein
LIMVVSPCSFTPLVLPPSFYYLEPPLTVLHILYLTLLSHCLPLSGIPSSSPFPSDSLPSLRSSLTTDWGHHTGTIDWCETNYSHSRYIAEFVNSLTNFPSIFLGLYGLYHAQNHGIPLRYGLCFLGLSLIGIGSFGFHASLRWEWQLMDELPMVCQLFICESGALMIDLPRHLCWVSLY